MGAARPFRQAGEMWFQQDSNRRWIGPDGNRGRGRPGGRRSQPAL